MLYSTPLPYATNAAAYFAAIADLPWAVWLDSGGRGRYDILCAQPTVTLVTYGTHTEITNASGVQCVTADPFDLLRQQLGAPVAAIPGIPFAGGALGYWGYDLARRLHTLPTLTQNTEHLPDMMAGIYDWALVLDHQEKSTHLVSQLREQATAEVLPQILARLLQSSKVPQEKFKVHGRIQSNFTRAGYKSAFDAIQRFLRAGDCYQVNLAQRYAARASGHALQAYLKLRRLSPAPYSAYLNFPHAQILCASPERFLQVQQGRVETNPIKGTRPRLKNRHEDAMMAQELALSDKDHAENLMIVDLLRNDLGKSCESGSVHVPKLFKLESFAQVHHLVSTVIGQLAPGRDALTLLQDCFPGGSVTGAPKQRAMQIIEQLEPHRRGVYCGAIGYIGFDGNMDSNITIRTLVFADGEIRFWAGGGIVADSDADAEYQETLDKAAAILKVLQQYGGKYECEA
ncbi:aminodeoxychorismate synthase component I [Candidatus Nitrotoga sp. M5]|uniref:aminodeoxychorismate synthase component I n=1 Tax=Candidatus Nitrotoga sp. M5 TaxID=2890409 RepID=UPI001EF1E76D|nr:aminodeoxychorismate synthase component I [Candidatus Nitrotoga sp. M5]CAH1385861.1 Aminodeoxychorismate synthase component 1 [Candidatus Nitrotoga sp. M5]